MRLNRLIPVILTLAAAALPGCGGSGPSAMYELAAQGVHAGALSPRSELALIGSLNHGGSLWRTGAHERLFSWNHRQGEFSQLVATAFSPDGTRAVTTDPRTLVIWDTRSGQSVAFWTTPSAAMDVAIGDDGVVLMGLADHSAVLFDGGTGTHRKTFLHEGPVTSVSLSGNGRWALTGGDDGVAALWDTVSGGAVHRLTVDGPVRVAALSAAGRYAFTAGPGDVARVWNGADGAVAFTVSGDRTAVTSAGFSPDEAYLLVGYLNRRVELWDVASQRRLARWHIDARNPWRPTGAAVLAVGFSASAQRFYALAGDGRLVQLTRR